VWVRDMCVLAALLAAAAPPPSCVALSVPVGVNDSSKSM
jgi:hypothetical protein